MQEKNEIIIYTTPDGKETFEVSLKEDTVWLSQRQMAELFEKDVRTVNEHIINIYKEKELSKSSTIRKFRIVQREGNRQVERERNCYNLDVIISVGYRVKSQRGTQFRIWATNVLKQHLIDGEDLYLEGARETFTEWDRKGYRIILTTGRRESVRDQTEEQLNKVGIFYDCLIMGISGGTRVLINDHKPDKTDPTAIAINLERNEGVKKIKDI